MQPVSDKMEKATYYGRHIVKFRYGNQFLIGKLYADKELHDMMRFDTTTEEDLKRPFFVMLSDGKYIPLLACKDVEIPGKKERFLFLMNGSWCLGAE